MIALAPQAPWAQACATARALFRCPCCSLTPPQQNDIPPKNKPCEWVSKALSGKVGNEGLTVSVVKESGEPSIHCKRAYFRGKQRPQLSLCGPVLETCAGHTLGPIDYKMLKRSFCQNIPHLPLTCIFLASKRGKREKGSSLTCSVYLHYWAIQQAGLTLAKGVINK